MTDDLKKRFEEERIQFMKLYRKNKLINNLALFIAVALIAVIYIVVQAQLQQTMIALAGVAAVLVGLYVFSKLTKPKVEAATKAYIEHYYTLVNEATFPLDQFSDATVDPKEKIDPQQFIDAGFVKDVSRVNSRALTHVTLGGHPTVLCDLAAYALVNKRPAPVFVGKFVETQIADSEASFLIYLKPKVAGKGPEIPSDLAAVEETTTHAVYASKEWADKPLLRQIVGMMDGLSVGDLLTDGVLRVKDGKAYLALSYSDTLMVIPLQNPFVPEPLEHFSQDITTIARIFEILK